MYTKRLIALLLLLAFPQLVRSAESQWVLQQSTLTYHVSHPLHQVDGVSRAARGMGACKAGQCDFLIAVPVNSFDSGDSNRDLHMLQATRGAQFPMVSVRVKVPEEALASTTIRVDLDVEFAGQRATYRQVPLALEHRGNEVHLTGTIPANLSDFKIEPPSLLMVPIKSEIPVRLDMTWRQQ